MEKKLRPLGVAQLELLAEMKARGGYWYPGCGWNARSNSNTSKTLDTLVKRGLLNLATTQHGATYTLTEE